MMPQKFLKEIAFRKKILPVIGTTIFKIISKLKFFQGLKAQEK